MVLDYQSWDDRDARLPPRRRKPAWFRTAVATRALRGALFLLAVLEVVGINLNVLLFIRRDRALFEDGSHRARRLTGTAVDAFIRINEELLDVIVVAFALRGMNAIYRTDVHAGTVFKTHAWAGNHVRHGTNNLLIRNSQEKSGRSRKYLRPADERDTLAAVSALIIPISGINCYLLAEPHGFKPGAV
jgi:hypothetical protein